MLVKSKHPIITEIVRPSIEVCEIEQSFYFCAIMYKKGDVILILVFTTPKCVFYFMLMSWKASCYYTSVSFWDASSG